MLDIILNINFFLIHWKLLCAAAAPLIVQRLPRCWWAKAKWKVGSIRAPPISNSADGASAALQKLSSNFDFAQLLPTSERRLESHLFAQLLTVGGQQERKNIFSVLKMPIEIILRKVCVDKQTWLDFTIFFEW